MFLNLLLLVSNVLYLVEAEQADHLLGGVGVFFFIEAVGTMQFMSGEERVADNCPSSRSQTLLSSVLGDECPGVFLVSALVMALQSGHSSTGRLKNQE